jgi:hypothetical protein
MGVSIARRVFIRVSAWRPSDDKGNFEADFDEIPHEEDMPATHCSGRSSGRGTIPALQMSTRQCQGITPTTPLFAHAPSAIEKVKRDWWWWWWWWWWWEEEEEEEEEEKEGFVQDTRTEILWKRDKESDSL